MSDQHRHELEIRGYNDLLAEHCELVDRVAALTARMEQMAAELRRLGCQTTITQEIIVDLGHGWQIMREEMGDTEATDGMDATHAA